MFIKDYRVINMVVKILMCILGEIIEEMVDMIYE